MAIHWPLTLLHYPGRDVSLFTCHMEVNVTWKVPVAFRKRLRIGVDNPEHMGQILPKDYYCK